ncbi:hypothetical protein BDW02DRAFT_578263 [Decorospora gaudefroyi]|uniref:Uncharacterized protein n=1 Tax=Decorospora gaudefroyi TaxID=184978 RepID=A0A6A5KKE2_9PLEO|nr:hypothetical protein BDW02DRAFT_578263 [Decorospora gaudefroyi]
MSVAWPSFDFPSPGPTLPPLPESTLQPYPSRNVSNSDDQMHWYMESALQDLRNWPLDGFGSEKSGVRVYDIIEPRWYEPDDGRPGPSISEWVYALELYCLVCLPAADGSPRRGDGVEGYPFCANDTSDLASVSSRAGSDDGVSRGGDRVEISVPVPDASLPAAENTTLACTIVMYFLPGKPDEESWMQPVVMSRLFMASYKPRDGASSFEGAIVYQYSRTSPFGWRNTTGTPSFPTSLPTSAPRPPVDFCTPGRYDNCRTDGWYGWSTGKRLGIVIGVVIGIAIILSLIWCGCKRSKWGVPRQKERPMLLSELRAQQSRENQASTGQGRVSQRRAPTAAVTPRAGEADLDKPPPAYHETVNDQERMLAEYAMQRDNQTAAPPPSYDQPTATGDTSASASAAPASHPIRVTNRSPCARAAYPQLPATPVYHAPPPR